MPGSIVVVALEGSDDPYTISPHSRSPKDSTQLDVLNLWPGVQYRFLGNLFLGQQE